MKSGQIKEELPGICEEYLHGHKLWKERRGTGSVEKQNKKATTAPKFNLSTAVCVGATVGGNKSVSS